MKRLFVRLGVFSIDFCSLCRVCKGTLKMGCNAAASYGFAFIMFDL